MYRQELYGIPVGNSICIMFGDIPRKCFHTTMSAVRFHSDELDYGVVFAQELPKYEHIAETRDYGVNTYVTICDGFLMVGKEPKPNWYLLRPDTIEDIVEYLLNMTDCSMIKCSYGDTFNLSKDNLISVLCYCWNNAF